MRKLYKSCSTLPIGRFFRIFDNDDLRNLIIDFDFENDTYKLSEIELNEYHTIFDDIYFEYSELSQNHKLRGHLVKKGLINEWTFLYQMISSLINIYIEHRNIDTLKLINEIDEPKYHINFNKNITKEVQSLIQKMKGLKNKIKIFKLKLAESIKNSKVETKIDLERDAIYLEKNLELNRSIDPETTSVKAWLKLVELSKQRKDGKDTNNKSRGRRTN